MVRDQTRKIIEAAVLQAGTQLDDSFLNSPYCLIVYAPDGSVVRANPAWEHLFGVSTDDLKDYNILHDHHMVESGESAEIQRVFAGEATYTFQPRLYDPAVNGKKGRPRWIEARFYPRLDPGGSVLEVVGIIEDVTFQKTAESAFRAGEEKFLLLAEVIPQIVITTDSQGQPNYYNRHFYEYTGFKPHDWSESLWSEVVHPEDRPNLAQAWKDALNSGKMFEQELRLRNAEGVYHWLLGRTVPFRDEAGEIVRWFGTLTDIDKQKQAEAALQQSDRQRQLIMDSAPSLIAYVDRDYRYRFVNATYEKWFHVRREDLVGKTVAEIAGDEAFGVVHERMDKALSGTKIQFQTHLPLKIGPPRFVDVAYTPDIDATGTVRGVIAVINDITEMKQAEEELRQSRDQLEIILQSVREGIVVYDGHGHLVYANTAAAQLSGVDSIQDLFRYDRDELTEQFELYDSDGHLFPVEKLPGRLASKGELNPPEVLLRVRNKSTEREHWAITTSRAVVDEKGAPQFIINVFRDYTERKRQDELAAFKAEAVSTLNSSLEVKVILEQLTQLAVPRMADWCAVYLTREDRTVEQVAVAHVDPSKVHWARELAQRYPLDMDAPSGVGAVLRTGNSELISHISDDLVEAAARDPEHHKVLQAVGFHSYLCAPIKLRDKVLGAFVLISAESRQTLHSSDLRLAEDLGSRAALAIENARLYEQAQKVNRIKDEFLATLSHELRTPLNVILGHAELLRTESGIADAETQQSIEAIERNAKAQTQIISDLLDVSAIITGKLVVTPREIEPSSIVKSAVESVRLAAEAKKINLQVDVPPGLERIHADATRLQQIIWNLLSNAVKFTPSGGSIRVRTRVADGRFKIFVEDSGLGIDPEFLPYVFDRFRQEDSSMTRRHGGLGLGLSIVRNLAEIHGGTVHAESKGRNLGSTFVVSLPLLMNSNDRAHSTQSPDSAGSTNADLKVLPQGLRILLVEDEDDARDLITRMLKLGGADVRAAPSAAVAYGLIQTFQPDILVSDIGMPDEDGLSFMRRIRANESQSGNFVPAIALTAYAREDERRRVLSAGYQVHLAKPVTADELLSAIVNLIAVG